MTYKQAGISLVETMIGLAIAAGISVVLMKQQETSSRMQSKNNSDQIINSAAQIIQSSLSNRAICTLSLRTRGLGDPVLQIVDGSIDPANFNNFLPSGKIIADTTTLLPGDVKIDSMKIVEEGPVGNKLEYLSVVFNPNPRGNKKMFGGKVFAKKFRIQGQKVSGKFTVCYSEASNLLQSAVQTSCAALGGVWNPATQKCDIADIIKRSDLTQLWRNSTGALTATKPPDTPNGEVTCQKNSKRCSRTNMDCTLPACPVHHYQGNAWEWDREQSTWDLACMKSAKCMYIAQPAGWMVKP